MVHTEHIHRVHMISSSVSSVLLSRTHHELIVLDHMTTLTPILCGPLTVVVGGPHGPQGWSGVFLANGSWRLARVLQKDPDVAS